MLLVKVPDSMNSISRSSVKMVDLKVNDHKDTYVGKHRHRVFRRGKGTCYLGVYSDVPFSWVYVLTEKSRAECSRVSFLKKTRKQGNTRWTYKYYSESKSAARCPKKVHNFVHSGVVQL